MCCEKKKELQAQKNKSNETEITLPPCVKVIERRDKHDPSPTQIPLPLLRFPG
jgi:hypothetical protein